jgi:predicted tellurium resistance membrane protein TerC
LSFAFNVLFWWAVRDATGSAMLATEKSLEFLTGYLIEKSLAVDNILVFLLIFSYFAVPSAFQKRVLMAAVAAKFHLLNYGLAVILMFIGGKMCLIDFYKIPVGVSLGVVVGILAVTMLLSLRKPSAEPLG